jgi:hypothetical protein
MILSLKFFIQVTLTQGNVFNNFKKPDYLSLKLEIKILVIIYLFVSSHSDKIGIIMFKYKTNSLSKIQACLSNQTIFSL